MALSINGVKSKGTFATPRYPGKHDKFVFRDFDIDVFEVVLSGSFDGDVIHMARKIPAKLCGTKIIAYNLCMDDNPERIIKFPSPSDRKTAWENASLARQLKDTTGGHEREFMVDVQFSGGIKLSGVFQPLKDGAGFMLEVPVREKSPAVHTEDRTHIAPLRVQNAERMRALDWTPPLLSPSFQNTGTDNRVTISIQNGILTFMYSVPPRDPNIPVTKAEKEAAKLNRNTVPVPWKDPHELSQLTILEQTMKLATIANGLLTEVMVTLKPQDPAPQKD